MESTPLWILPTFSQTTSESLRHWDAPAAPGPFRIVVPAGFTSLAPKPPVLWFGFQPSSNGSPMALGLPHLIIMVCFKNLNFGNSRTPKMMS